MEVIDIGNVFFRRLLNRNHLQGDGKHTAMEFRDKYLVELDDTSWWKDKTKKIELNFENVEVLGPSWTNEIFTYYLDKGIKPKQILKKIRCSHLSKTKEMIIHMELGIE